MKRILMLALLAGLQGCGGGGSAGSGAAPGTVNYIAASGVAQKGPLILGSTVTVQELDSKLSPNGKQYSYQVNSDLGTFNPTSSFGSPYIGVNATGYYFDEVAGAISGGTITLNGISDLSSSTVLNVNLLTTLAYQRVISLVNNVHLSIPAAQLQAEDEVLAALGIPDGSSYGHFGSLDLSHNGDGDKILAAVSSIFVYGHSAGELSALVASFQSDIADNGVIDSTATLTALHNASAQLDPVAVAAALNGKYAALGVSYTAADISSWLDQDGSGIIGKFHFVQLGVQPSTAVTSTPYVVKASDNGASLTPSAGTLIVNGVAANVLPVLVHTGDSVSISLISGAGAGDTVSSTLRKDGRTLASFSVQTKKENLTVATTLTGIGHVNNVALAADEQTLYVVTADSCITSPTCAPPALDGGLYTYDLSTPLAPARVGHGQFPTQGYDWTDYYSIVLSADATTAFVGSAGAELKVLDISDRTAPGLRSSVSTSAQALALVPAPGGSTLYVATSGYNIIQVNVSNPLSPQMGGGTTINNQPFGLALAPDGLQLAMADQGMAQLVGISGGVLGDATDIIAAAPEPQTVAYIGNRILLVASHEFIRILDVSTPAAPTLISKIPTGNKVIGMAGVSYDSATHRAYVAIGNQLEIVDVTDPARPVIRGNITLNETGPFANSVNSHAGIAISADGSVIYVSSFGRLTVISHAP
jgi:hypothetical protein